MNDLSLNDLVVTLQVYDRAISRGAIHGAEFSTVGNVYDKLTAMAAEMQKAGSK